MPARKMTSSRKMIYSSLDDEEEEENNGDAVPVSASASASASALVFYKTTRSRNYAGTTATSLFAKKTKSATAAPLLFLRKIREKGDDEKKKLTTKKKVCVCVFVTTLFRTKIEKLKRTKTFQDHYGFICFGLVFETNWLDL